MQDDLLQYLSHLARELHILAQISCTEVQEKWPQSCKTLHETYKSTLARLLASLAVVQDTVEPPNNGHIGGGSLVHCREVVLISEVR